MLSTRNGYARQADRPLRLYVNGSMKAIQCDRMGKGKKGGCARRQDARVGMHHVGAEKFQRGSVG